MLVIIGDCGFPLLLIAESAHEGGGEGVSIPSPEGGLHFQADILRPMITASQTIFCCILTKGLMRENSLQSQDVERISVAAGGHSFGAPMDSLTRE
jgi:hypothetical protein